MGRKILFCLASFVLLLGAGRAEGSSAKDRLDQLAVATSLDHPGAAPWHLRESFDLFELDGKAGESGTIEEWWISPTEPRGVITRPTFRVSYSGAVDAMP